MRRRKLIIVTVVALCLLGIFTIWFVPAESRLPVRWRDPRVVTFEIVTPFKNSNYMEWHLIGIFPEVQTNGAWRRWTGEMKSVPGGWLFGGSPQEEEFTRLLKRQNGVLELEVGGPKVREPWRVCVEGQLRFKSPIRKVPFSLPAKRTVFVSEAIQPD